MKKNIYIFDFIGVSILLFMFSIVAILSTILLLGGHCHHGIFSASLIICIVASVFLFSKNLSKKELIIYSIVVIFLIIFSLIFCGSIFNYDYDGNNYHKVAVGLLKNGWNPILESGKTFSARYFNSSVAPISGIVIDHYGKTTWLFASVMYFITDNIDCGKSYQLLGCISLFCISFSFFLSRKRKTGISIFLAFLLTFNPVTLSQLLSYYVDGYLFSLLYILLIALFQLADNTITEKKIPWVMIFSSMLLLSNVKFTGLLYGGIVCILVYGGIVIYSTFINKQYISQNLLLKYFFAFVILAVLCVCWIGYPTYITNFIDHGSFTYPLTGEGKIDIITGQAPSGFVNKSNLYKLFYCIFGQMGNILYDNAVSLPKLKIPFTIGKAELFIPSVDTRIAGYGFFFSGLLIISLIGIVLYIITKNNRKDHKILIAISLFLILLFSIAVPNVWWARFNPFLWLIILIYLYIYEPDSCIKKKLYYVFNTLILINTLYFSLCPIQYMYRSYFKESEHINNTKIKTDLFKGNYPGVLFNLEDKGIEYEVVESLEKIDGYAYCIYYAYPE